MSDRRITPRAAAFQQQALEQAQAVDQAVAHADALATHSDPSLAARRTAAAGGRSDDRISVEWVYPSDAVNRIAGAGLAHGAELHMRAHAWLRAQRQRIAPHGGRDHDKPAPAAQLQPDVPERQSPGVALSR